jgi:hypothetical protein
MTQGVVKAGAGVSRERRRREVGLDQGEGVDGFRSDGSDVRE